MKNFKNAAFMLAAVTFLFIQTSCTRVSPTEAGFKIENGGSYRGIDSLPLVTGWNFYMPGASSIITIPTTLQHVVWTKDNKEGSESNQEISVSCLGGAGFNMDIGFNYHVDATKASKIYLKYKMDDLDKISDTYLRNVVRKSMQDISSTMTVDSILNNLSGYENNVSKILTTRLATEGFIVDNFNILSRPTPSDPNLAAAINNKIKAKQNAETAKQELQISIAEANKKIATARGDSATAVIEASGKAEAIAKLQKQLTQEYVEYQKVQKWNGAYPTTMLGAGTGTLLSIK